MQTNAPTKGNLMAAKRSRSLAKTGWDLMDRKRSILIRELMGRVDEAHELQDQIGSAFAEAYAALRTAELSSGDCAALAAAVEVDESVRLRFRSVMGVEIPAVEAKVITPDTLPYDLADSSAALDEAYRKFTALKGLIARLSETETAVYRLAVAIRKAQKRANALENVVIPGLDQSITHIAEVLEEREREEFVRMKVIKARK